MYIKRVFEILFKYFGPQGWWHADSEFEICVGIILVQRTTWKNAAKAIENLRKSGLLNAEEIVSVSIKGLRILLRPTGFYRQKTCYLRAFSRHCLEKYGGSFEKWFVKPTSELREELLGLRGIGEETADSILLYAAEKPTFVVDAYTKRILVRMGIVKMHASLSEIKNLIEREAPPYLQAYKELRALFVELAKNFCKSTPRCDTCPLKSLCQKHI